MQVERNGTSDQEERLDEAVTAYLQAAEAGMSPDRRSWLERYPELTSELTEFFADLDDLDSLTAPLRAAAGLGPSTSAPEPTPTQADGRPGIAPIQIPEEGFAFGNFQILQEIGRGGMGVVYRARQRSPNRLVALKMIRSGAWATDAEIQRFRNEAEAAGALDHPHIVPVYEVGQEQGQLYYTLRLVEGTNLAQVVPRFQSDPRGAASLMAIVARAVHHAHQRGVLHRDLKPSNILIDRDGVPHVTDFGLAKRLAEDPSLTQTGAVVGTPSYMAPEQAAGRKGAVSTASDVFSLGAILYTLLAGEAPFRGDTPYAVLEQLRWHDPPPLTERGRHVDRDLETIVRKCLEKDAPARYGSAAALAEDLERWLAGVPIEARPVGRLARVGRWSRRNPLVAGLLTSTAALVLFAVVGLAVSTFVINDARQEALRQRDQAIAAEARARQGELVTRQNLYVADMRLAWNAWRSSKAKLVGELLSRHLPAPARPDLCGFEWRYLHRMARGEDRILRGHTGEVYHVSYSPDGTRLASAAADGTIRVWDAGTGQELCTLQSHKGEVNAVSFCPDGRLLASAGDDGTIRLWDMTSMGAKVVNSPCRMWAAHAGDALEVEFAPNGRQLASAGSDGLAKLWDLATGRLLASYKGHDKRIQGLAFAPNGKVLATAGRDNSVRLWAVPPPDRNPLATPPVLVPLRTLTTAAQVTAVAFSPDGQRLALTEFAKSGPSIWDLSAGTDPSQPVIEHGNAVLCVAYSRDGRLLASADTDGAIKVLDLETRQVQTLLGHDLGAVYRVAFGPANRTLASAGGDGTVRIWELGREPEHRRLPLPSSDGYRYLAFSPDGKVLATKDVRGMVRLWQVGTWRLLWELPGMDVSQYGSPTLLFSPDGGTLAVVAEGHTVRLWDVATKHFRTELPGPPGARDNATFSADGRFLATRGMAEVVLWDAATTQPLRTLSEKSRGCGPMALSPNGQQLVAALSQGNDLLVWDSKKGETTMGRLATGKSWTLCLGFSPDGRTFVTGNDDGTVTFWDAATQRVRAAAHHPRAADCLAFSPEGQTLATGGRDGKIRLWNVPTAQELLALDAPEQGVLCLAFSPTGDMLAAAITNYGSKKATGVYVWTADPAPASAVVHTPAIGQ
jgi:WD40 repeat protein